MRVPARLRASIARITTLASTICLSVFLFTACGGNEPAPIEVNPPSSTATAATTTPAATVTATIPTSTPTETPSPTATEATSTPEATATIDDGQPSPGAVSLTSLVSKQWYLPADYVPPSVVAIPDLWAVPGFGVFLRADIVEAMQPMIEAAAADGVDLHMRSGYRSYDEQVATFQYWVDLKGEEQARRESAVPGHSEHQLGTVADFASPVNGWELEAVFGETPSGQWLAANAWQYGFAMSYPQGMEAVTGYIYEPWHFRFIGIQQAANWHDSGLTLIEYLEALNGVA